MFKNVSINSQAVMDFLQKSFKFYIKKLVIDPCTCRDNNFTKKFMNFNIKKLTIDLYAVMYILQNNFQI